MPRILGRGNARAIINGERIVELRTAENLKQREWASRAGISRSLASLIENGKVTRVSPVVLEQIAQSFGVNKEDLIGGESSIRAARTRTLHFTGIEEDSANRDQVLEELRMTMTYASRLVHMLENK